MAVLIGAPAANSTQPICFDSAKKLARFHLKPDQLYAQGRRSLAHLGWKPAKPNVDDDFVKVIIPSNWTEFTECSGTGWGFCSSVWRKNKNCLRVTSYGDHGVGDAEAIRRLVAVVSGQCETMLND